MISFCWTMTPGDYFATPQGRVISRLLTPLFGDLSTEPMRAETRARLYLLRDVLVSFSNDIGVFPYVGTTLSTTSVLLANDQCFNLEPDKNVLTCAAVIASMTRDNFLSARRQMRWKGPYIPLPLDKVWRDAWGNKIQYVPCLEFHSSLNSGTATGISLYLQSGAEDGRVDPIEVTVSRNYPGDDLTVKIQTIQFP